LAQREEFRQEQAERKRIQDRLERAQARERQQQRQRRQRLRLAGWTVVGAGLAMGLAGGLMGVVSLVDKRFVEGAEKDRLFSELKPRYDRSNTLRQVAWAGIGSGLAVAAAGGILLWLGYRRTQAGSDRPTPLDRAGVSITPVIGPQQTGMTLRLRF
jgi:hypothetical protein